MSIKWTHTLAIVMMAFILTACDKDGPAENLGESIDQTVEETKENISEKMDPRGPAEKAGEQLDEATEEIKEEARQARENIEEEME